MHAYISYMSNMQCMLIYHVCQTCNARLYIVHVENAIHAYISYVSNMQCMLIYHTYQTCNACLYIICIKHAIHAYISYISNMQCMLINHICRTCNIISEAYIELFKYSTTACTFEHSDKILLCTQMSGSG